MTFRINALAAAVVSSALFTSTARAHHSAAMYDPGKTLEVSGTLKTVQIGNPHSWFWISVPNAQGGNDLWGFEGGSVAQVERGDVKASDYFAIGQRVKVSYHPLRDGRPSGELLSMGFEDGRIFSNVSGAVPPPATSASPAP